MKDYGINIDNRNLEFDYDKYYKEFSMKLKSFKDIEKQRKYKKIENINFSNSINIEINFEKLKENFINILVDSNSSAILWTLYSKYIGENENYIEKISNILKLENKVIRSGTNTYKINGWMTHTLYVYQIVNYNVPNNIELKNFNGDIENKRELQEVHNIYKTLSEEAKFILKIFSLIHDIGVIENIQFHDKIGAKYVKQVLREIGLTQEKLYEFKYNIQLEDLIKTLENVIKYHTLISLLSGESSDEYIEFSYKTLISETPNINLKNEIPKILFILAFADIIAVDESLMSAEKYYRTKQGYTFFEEISQNKQHSRNSEKVALERICDIVGKISYSDLENNFDNILENNNINKQIFIENMYNLRLMKYTGPLMKTVNNVEMTVKILDRLFDLITKVEGKDFIKQYIITFVPNKHEQLFLDAFNNGVFFECVNLAKESNNLNMIYKNIEFKSGNDELGKFLNIRIID